MVLTFLTTSSMVAVPQGKGMSTGELTSPVGIIWVLQQHETVTEISLFQGSFPAMLPLSHPSVACAHISDTVAGPSSLTSSQICPCLPSSTLALLSRQSSLSPRLHCVQHTGDFQTCFSTWDRSGVIDLVSHHHHISVSCAF